MNNSINLKAIIDYDKYLQKCAEEFNKETEQLRVQIEEDFNNIIQEKSAEEIIRFLNNSNSLDSDQKKILAQNFKNGDISVQEGIFIAEEILTNDSKKKNLNKKDIQELSGFNKYMSFVQSGAINLATKKIQEFSLDLIDRFSETDASISKTGADGERLIEIPELTYKTIMQKFKSGIDKLASESINNLNTLSINIMPEFIPQLQDIILDQGNYIQSSYLTQITGKTPTFLFRKQLSLEELNSEIKENILISKKDRGYYNFLKVQTPEKDLDELDLEIMEAYFTEKKENPEATGITFLDLAHDIYRSKSGNRLESRDKFVKEVEERCRRLVHLPFILDFNEQIDYILTHYKDSPVKDNVLHYRESGGSGVIETNFISANIKPLKKANGKVIGGLVFLTSKDHSEDLVFDYIEMMQEYKRIPQALLFNPMSATSENVMVHNYLAKRITQLPYNDKKHKFMSQKLHLLKGESNIKVLKTSTEYQEALSVQKSIPREKLTVRLDTLKKDLKLKTRTTRLVEKITRSLDDWQKENYLDRYEVNYTNNNRSVESFTIYIF